MSVSTLNNPLTADEMERYSLTPYTEALKLTPHLANESDKKAAK